MKRDVPGFVAVTDDGWFKFLRAKSELDEVNFWRPTPTPVRQEPGTPWFFKAKWPTNAIVGGAFFAHYSTMSASLAWECFGEKNGAESERRFIESLLRLKRGLEREVGATAYGSIEIGCVILSDPYFFPPDEYVAAPADFSPNTVTGKGYDLASGFGRELWERVQLRRSLTAMRGVSASFHEQMPFGAPMLVRPRLGQGGFRASVLDAYGRRCAVTGERTQPVLEAAHIKPFSIVQKHEVANGLSLRTDLHRLFDKGYVSVDPSLRFRVSSAIRKEYENGKDYYAMHNREIRLPEDVASRPQREYLEWHVSEVYRGD